MSLQLLESCKYPTKQVQFSVNSHKIVYKFAFKLFSQSVQINVLEVIKEHYISSKKI